MYYLFKWEEEEAGEGCDVFLIEHNYDNNESDYCNNGKVVNYNKLHKKEDWVLGDPYSIDVYEQDGESLICKSDDYKEVLERYYLEIL